jgi:[ribosomal protein S5]-alanine N-acetyltransferase
MTMNNGSTWPDFYTERLHLRAMNQDDHAFIFTLTNSPEWIEFIGDRNIRTEADARAYIKRIEDNDHYHFWTACKREDGTPMGVVTYIQRDYLDHPDLGFAFLKPFTGQGFAYEAAKEALALMYERFPKLYATTVPGNVNSIRLLEKLGYHFDQEIVVAEEPLRLYAFPT